MWNAAVFFATEPFLELFESTVADLNYLKDQVLTRLEENARGLTHCVLVVGSRDSSGREKDRQLDGRLRQRRGSVQIQDLGSEQGLPSARQTRHSGYWLAVCLSDTEYGVWRLV